MRGRSHRFQRVDPHDDWVDGSWTVDCVCGVTFDDGEEMVNCDECGVWVHTRCSKYVKGEELFACDNCKNKNSRNISHNESEETEVAQLLVELPTKTVRLDSSYGGPARKPISLWTNIPMENRVHVQGIPGGDPGLFNGLSTVFTPELWKCTGYVPKKFNIQYKEFPWDGEDCGDKKEDGNDYDKENPVDRGAGVLFSLSKENVHGTPVAAMVGMRGRDEEVGLERKVYSKEMKKWDSEGVDRRSQSGMTKERSLLRPAIITSGKRKKEDFGASKDRNAKKKARASEEVGDRKKYLLASRTVFRPSSDAKQVEFYEDRGPKSSKTDIQNTKNKNLPEDVQLEYISDCHPSVGNVVDKPKSDIAANECPLDASEHNFSNVAGLEEETAGHQTLAAMKGSPTNDDISGSVSELNDARSIPIEQEGENMAVDELNDSMKSTAQNFGNPLAEDVASFAQEIMSNQIPKKSNSDMSRTPLLPTVEMETELINRGHLNAQSCPGDLTVQSKSENDMSKISTVNDVVASNSQSTPHQALDTRKSSEAISLCFTVNVHEVTGDPHLIKREQESSDVYAEEQKSSSEFNHFMISEERSKGDGTSSNSSALANHHNKGRTSSSSNTLVSKSYASEIVKSADAQNCNSTSKQRLMSDSNASVRKDCDLSNVVKDEIKHDMSRKSVREQSESFVNSVSKLSHSSRISHATFSKPALSDAKCYASFSSSKPSVLSVATTVSGEGSGSLPSQCTHAQNKMSASTLPLKGDKSSQSNIQPSPKVNHASLMHPPVASNSPATLSDEELALLLHQELNSSPRVPRVPRVRHTGSLPQLSSPTAASILIKRTFSSGGKDHNLVSRRKNKDASGDVFSSREVDDESRKSHRVLSADLRRQDIGYAADANTRREDSGSSIAVRSTKKNMPSASTTTANSGPASSAEVNDHNASSMRNSPRTISDDDTGTNRAPVRRTLPGLINEIMGKGRRMTYEELCNAVLPHWPHLRKHNGERYAYSSHSQAVLDCLRNRHEWARLVDRGPKTSSSRKRRKMDADESEDNEYGNEGTAREPGNKGLVSQREDFPKGKRKARKRRRLALQGRRIKDVRKRGKVDFPSDGDVSPLSNSSGETLFSDDGSHGGGACPAASEASFTSDEAGTS